jgi:hypothetical protein
MLVQTRCATYFSKIYRYNIIINKYDFSVLEHIYVKMIRGLGYCYTKQEYNTTALKTISFWL